MTLSVIYDCTGACPVGKWSLSFRVEPIIPLGRIFNWGAFIFSLYTLSTLVILVTLIYFSSLYIIFNQDVVKNGLDPFIFTFMIVGFIYPCLSVFISGQMFLILKFLNYLYNTLVHFTLLAPSVPARSGDLHSGG